MVVYVLCSCSLVDVRYTDRTVDGGMMGSLGYKRWATPTTGREGLAKRRPCPRETGHSRMIDQRLAFPHFDGSARGLVPCCHDNNSAVLFP